MRGRDLTTTREKLLQTAHDLFYRDGFHAVGLENILDAVGVSKTTFYNHFESKEDLFLEVLRGHDRWWREEFTRKLRHFGGDRPRDQLLAVFDVIDELIRIDTYNGCVFINVAVQFPLPHEPAHVAAVEHKRAMEEILRMLAGYAGADDPAALARELSLLIEGTYITHQVTHDAEWVNVGRRLAAALLDARIPQASQRSAASHLSTQ